MANPFVHIELLTGDADKAKAFYGALFEWNLEYLPTDLQERIRKRVLEKNAA